MQTPDMHNLATAHLSVDTRSLTPARASLLPCCINFEIHSGSIYRSLAKKGPLALYLTLSPDKGVGGYF